VVTRSGALDPAGPLFTDTIVPPLVITCGAAPTARLDALAGLADVILAGEEEVEMPAMLDALADRGLRRVGCEGGPTLLAQLTAAGRLDELSLTVSPLLLAGPAPRILSGPPLPAPARLTPTLILEDDGFVFLRYRVG
jgi:riboflavin biosynthesis pyrimidine reductase